jgi:hypothetical protein
MRELNETMNPTPAKPVAPVENADVVQKTPLIRKKRSGKSLAARFDLPKLNTRGPSKADRLAEEYNAEKLKPSFQKEFIKTDKLGEGAMATVYKCLKRKAPLVE